MGKGKAKTGKPPWAGRLKRICREEEAQKQYRKTVLKLLVEIKKILLKEEK